MYKTWTGVRSPWQPADRFTGNTDLIFVNVHSGMWLACNEKLGNQRFLEILNTIKEKILIMKNLEICRSTEKSHPCSLVTSIFHQYFGRLALVSHTDKAGTSWISPLAWLEEFPPYLPLAKKINVQPFWQGCYFGFMACVLGPHWGEGCLQCRLQNVSAKSMHYISVADLPDAKSRMGVPYLRNILSFSGTC